MCWAQKCSARDFTWKSIATLQLLFLIPQQRKPVQSHHHAIVSQAWEFEGPLETLICHHWIHTEVPVCLGSGFSGLAHKVAAMLQACALEQGPGIEHLQAFLSSVVSWTTDMGTEFGFSSFKYAGPLSDSLLPSWFLIVTFTPTGRLVCVCVLAA